MTAARPSPDRLELDSTMLGRDMVVIITVNGSDIASYATPDHRSGGGFRSPPARCVLPPESFALLPSGSPTAALVSVCGCGVAGCGSLWVRLHRHGDRVVWEPDPRSRDATVDRRWEFELTAYLDAIDGAVAGRDAIEHRADRVARTLRARRDSMIDGFTLQNQTHVFRAGSINAVDDRVVMEVMGPDGITSRHVELPDDRTDDDIISRLSWFEPEPTGWRPGPGPRDRIHPWERGRPWPDKVAERQREWIARPSGT